MLMFCFQRPQICAVFGAVSISNNSILIIALNCVTCCNNYTILNTCLYVIYASLTLRAADNIGKLMFCIFLLGGHTKAINTSGLNADFLTISP
jgi:hypothetical protein